MTRHNVGRDPLPYREHQLVPQDNGAIVEPCCGIAPGDQGVGNDDSGVPLFANGAQVPLRRTHFAIASESVDRGAVCLVDAGVVEGRHAPRREPMYEFGLLGVGKPRR